MTFLRSIPRSGVSRRLLAALSLLVPAAACVPRYGFAGGGLPPHVRTMAIAPFENETPSAELSRELQEAMRKDFQPRLGVRDAPPERADALVRGIIRTYDVDVPVSYTGNQVQPTASRRMLQLIVDVEIVDQTTGKTLFERKGLRGSGEYAERDEAAGRREAIRRIVNDMVEGAQSQW